MKTLKYNYLVEVQFLGFRFHGWQTQANHKTVQETILTILQKIFPEKKPKIQGSSRTDSMVSAEHYLLMLTIDAEIEVIMPPLEFESLFNDLLPADIKFLRIKKMEPHFNIIQSPKLKEYHYYFSFGDEKPLVSVIIVNLNGGQIFWNCLVFLSKIDYSTCELIVVDNGSSDDSLQRLKNFKYSNVQVIKNSKNLGFAKASNQGYEESRGEYILLLNLLCTFSFNFMIPSSAENFRTSILPSTITEEPLKQRCITNFASGSQQVTGINVVSSFFSPFLSL